MTDKAQPRNSTLCWLRGVAFATLFSPVCGLMLAAALLVIREALLGDLDELAFGDLPWFILLGSLPAFFIAGPLGLVGGLVITALAIHWARTGTPLRSVAARLCVTGLVLGAASGFAIGSPWYPFTDARGSDAMVLGSLGLVVGVLVGGLFTRALGKPYRRLAAGQA